VATRTRNLQRLGYRRIVQLLVYLVIIPTVLLLALGILLMFLGEARINVILGIFTVAFVAVVSTGVILVLVFVRREANLSQLQADFVSKVSHELRTPLTAIRLFAETLQRSSDPQTSAKCIDMLNTETSRLTRRIERLLDWGRMEAGRKLFDLRDEDVQSIVDDAIAAFPPVRMAAEIFGAGESSTPQGAVDFGVDVAPGLPKIYADRHAIADAVVNLLSNAYKYGGTPPKVRLRAYVTPKGEVCIAVTDNGAGIPRVEHRRIFDKFYRIDDRLSRKRDGSGLGLAIVNHIVRAHHGRIVVDSSAGQGSTFSIVLPEGGHTASVPRVASEPPPHEALRPMRDP
jgi:two-component system, OmpR family, phosphate regulon sensor histidine kinase PhoR